MSDLLIAYLIIGTLFGIYTLFASKEARAIVERNLIEGILWFVFYIVFWFPIFIISFIFIMKQGIDKESEK